MSEASNYEVACYEDQIRKLERRLQESMEGRVADSYEFEKKIKTLKEAVGLLKHELGHAHQALKMTNFGTKIPMDFTINVTIDEMMKDV